MSYSGYKSSPRVSRGFSRGGYRGSSRGGGEWRGGGRGYGSSSRGSGRGRFSTGSGKWDRETSSSYEPRSRYTPGAERYSSRGRDDTSYRYRDDSMSGYSSREHSHRSSSPDRKRMRTEYSPASSMHRSHDYGDGIEYSSRSYGGYETKRISGYGGGDERRNMFREERERIRSDDYLFRKPLSIGPRHSTPRGSSYRGRSFSRGLRSGFRSEPYRGGSGFLRKRFLMDGYGVRKRIATGKTQEYLRRLKLYRIQRLRRMRDRVEKEESSDEDEEEEEIEEEVEVEEEVTDDENEETEENEKEEEEKEKKEVENEDEEMEEASDEKKEEPKKKTKKIKKMVKVVKKVKRKIPKKKEEKEKSENHEGNEIQVTVKQDSEGRDVDAPVRKNYLGIPFMKLECPHCNTTCVTFKEYLLHLYDPKHQSAMTNLTVKVRKTLAKMRLEQRTQQRDIDEECKLKKMNMRTFYCMVCKLNYRSLKSEHLESDKHMEMKKFLNPYCKICRLACRTPMLYENHLCSLDHLKRKHYYDQKYAERQEGELDMDKYMILDQVGSGEEEEESESESSEKDDTVKEGKEGETTGEGEEKEPKEKKPKKKKKIINLGSEYCKKIEIYFCDLCKTFLPRIEDQEHALAIHCRGKSHLRWFVKKKDELALRKRAERIRRMREEQKKAAIKEEETAKEEPMDEDPAEEPSKSEPDTNEVNSSLKTGGETEEVDTDVCMDEKMWTEVSKDLGDLLREVEEEPGNKSSDDEEDSRTTGRRYDRFKHSEKGKAENVDDNEANDKSVEEEGVKAEVNGDDKDDA